MSTLTGEAIADFIRTIENGKESIIDITKDVETGSTKISFGKRQLQPERPLEPIEFPIARAKARQHVFNDIETFAEYLTREASDPNALVLADVDARTFVAVLDESKQLDREIITLKAIEHPLFTPWGCLLGRAIPVIDFALFVMKHRRSVVEPDGKELAMNFQQIKMSKIIETQKGVGKRSLNGVMATVEIAGERKGVPVELPEVITIDVPLFVGSTKQRIELDVLVTDERENVVVFLTAADVEERRIQAFEEMIARLRESTSLLVGLGKIEHRNWEVLRS